MVPAGGEFVTLVARVEDGRIVQEGGARWELPATLDVLRDVG